MRKVIEVLSAILAFLLAGLGLYAYGKERGKEAQKQAEMKADIKVINELKKQIDEIDSLPAGDVRERMREFTKN